MLKLAAELGYVFRSRNVMGFTRDTFYLPQSAMESWWGIDALIDVNRRKLNPKNRVEETTETDFVALALAHASGLRSCDGIQ